MVVRLADDDDLQTCQNAPRMRRNGRGWARVTRLLNARPRAREYQISRRFARVSEDFHIVTSRGTINRIRKNPSFPQNPQYFSFPDNLRIFPTKVPKLKVPALTPNNLPWHDAGIFNFEQW